MKSERMKKGKRKEKKDGYENRTEARREKEEGVKEEGRTERKRGRGEKRRKGCREKKV